MGFLSGFSEVGFVEYYGLISFGGKKISKIPRKYVLITKIIILVFSKSEWITIFF